MLKFCENDPRRINDSYSWLTSCFETAIIIKIAGVAHPMTCNSADLVAIASELHLKTAVNPHDIVNASHQQRPAAKNDFYRLFTSKIHNEYGHVRRK